MIGRGIFRPGVTLMAIIMGVLMLAPIDSALAQSNFQNIPAAGRASGGRLFVGNLTISQFVVDRKGRVAAEGSLAGRLLASDGSPIGSVAGESVIIPIRNIRATCDILRLRLGPVNLELLGLRIHLRPILLFITAEQGGGLLGDLLCALAGALRPGGTIGHVIDLLNRILAILL